MGRPSIIHTSEERRKELRSIKPLNTAEIADFLNVSRRRVQAIYRTDKSFRKACWRISPKAEIQCLPERFFEWMAYKDQRREINATG
jgi:hypothetical protein